MVALTLVFVLRPQLLSVWSNTPTTLWLQFCISLSFPLHLFTFLFLPLFYVARTPAILAIVVAGCISEHCWSSNGKRQTFVRWSWTHLSIFVLSFILLLFNHTISRWVSTRMICNILRRTLTELKKGACDADLVASRNIFGSKLPAADQIVKITFYQLVSEKKTSMLKWALLVKGLWALSNKWLP